MVTLARLPVNWDKQKGLLERYWDRAMSAIEQSLNQLLLLPDIQDALTAAQTAADSAQNTADGAVQTVESTASRLSLINSYVTGLTISADSTGLVTISNHTRVYADELLNPSVSVTGGSISTGSLAGAIVRVYYVDAARTGGSVTYQFTVDPSVTPQDDDNHSVGVVTIPTTGSASGKGMPPPGYIYV